MRADDDDPHVPVALTCALGLVAALLAVVDTDLGAEKVPPARTLAATETAPPARETARPATATAPLARETKTAAPAAGFVRPPPPRRVIVVRRRSRAS